MSEINKEELKIGMIIPSNKYTVELKIIALTDHSVIYCGMNPDYFESISTIDSFKKNYMPKKELTIYEVLCFNGLIPSEVRYIEKDYYLKNYNRNTKILSERKVKI